MSHTRFKTALAAAGLTAVLAACADGGAGGPRDTARAAGQCFRPQQVTNFAAVDDNAVNIEVNSNRYYRLELMGGCPDIDFSRQLAIRAEGASSWICTGNDATLTVPTQIGGRRCPVRMIRPLSPQEVTALPDRARP